MADQWGLPDAAPRTRGQTLALVLGFGGVALSVFGIGLGWWARRRAAGGLAGQDPRAAQQVHRQVRAAQHLVEQAILDPVLGDRMRRLSLQITRTCPERDDMCEARAIAGFVAGSATARDPALGMFRKAFAATVHEPLDERQGGDEKAILTAVLLTMNGITARFRVSGNKDAPPSRMTVVAGLPKTRPSRWIPVGDAPLGRMFGDYNA